MAKKNQTKGRRNNTQGSSILKNKWVTAVCAVAGVAIIKSAPVLVGKVIGYFSKKKLLANETKAKKELNDNAAENTIRIIKTKNEGEKEIIELREKHRRERKEETTSATYSSSCAPIFEVEMPPTYTQIINNTMEVKEESLRIFVPWLHWYENIGIVGMNNNGKSTLVRQIARSMALGYQESSICPEWRNGTPVKVLMFALEHNKAHIKVYDAEQHKSIDNLLIKTDLTSIEEMMATIEKVAETAPDGLVVIIDNYTKLSEMVRRKSKVIELASWMEKFKAERQAQSKPIAYINVYHTVKHFSPTHSLGLEDVRGDSRYTMFSQEFLAMAPCHRGPEYRILKVLKNKYLSEERTVSVIRYANTDVKMYEYVEEAEECDELPSKTDLDRGAHSTKGSSDNVTVSSGKRGRPVEKNLSDEEYLLLYDMVKLGGTQSKEVEEAYNVSWKWIKTRAREIRARNEKIA